MNHRSSSHISRRNWLTTAVAAMATTAAGQQGLSSAAAAISGTTQSPDEHIPIIDTHQHLWDLKQLRTPWLESAPEELRQRFHNEEYATATAGLPIDQCVYMEIDVHPDDQQKEADLLLAQIANGRTPTKAAIISGRPDSEGFASFIRQFADKPAIKGVRQVLHPGTTPRGLCLHEQFIRSMHLLGEMGLSYDLCMRPAEIGDAVKLAQKCPETQFVLDHCGNARPEAFQKSKDQSPAGPSGHTADQWKRDIDDLAKCVNVSCKISGVIASVKQGQDKVELLSPIINHCLDAFGPDRVVFGGDWPVCRLGGTFAEWVSTLRTITMQRSVADKNKLWHQNARRIYRLSDAA
ncbi:MAG: amidohydrolase family protein [Planctomycetaceae bacterium]|nr:amidohydrolase family protein [Planctomycetaceae bacterium]